ncbi:hypothetical protein RIF29_30115 [Crotalaria pallida]|uniref:Uncharacterized protein n=1 Tax=Crotalaria pallida TaxID=3830 RepID=A0AAN9I110_CROPI
MVVEGRSRHPPIFFVLPSGSLSASSLVSLVLHGRVLSHQPHSSSQCRPSVPFSLLLRYLCSPLVLPPLPYESLLPPNLAASPHRHRLASHNLCQQQRRPSREPPPKTETTTLNFFSLTMSPCAGHF